MKKLLFFVTILTSGIVTAQGTAEPYKFTSLVDLYEFPPVGATGNLDVQLPLYTITNRGFELPLTLNYDQIGNSNAFYIGNQFGDAWVLSASGTISRECKDRPTPYFSSVQASSCGTTYTRETYRHYSLQNDEYYYSVNPSATSRTKPDIYTFSFLGLTGKFIIKKQGNQYIAEITETSDFASITIDSPPSGDNNNFESISITDKNGYKYKYANPTNINQNQSNKLVFARNAGFIPLGCSLGADSGDTAYEGHDIIDNNGGSSGSKNGDGLISTLILPGASRFWENMELTAIYDKYNNLLVSYEYDITGFANPGGFQWVNGLASRQSYQKLYLKKINITGQGSIVFNNVLGTNGSNVVNSYTSGIEISDLKNNLIKKFSFDYTVPAIHNIKYIKDHNDGSYGISFHKRLLSGVREFDNTLQKFLKTTVEYKNTSITNTNVIIDRYGFLTKAGYCPQHLSSNDYKADAYMLQRIKYPTGGSVVYKFEPNTFSHSLYNTNFKDYNYDNHLYTNINLSKSSGTATFTANAGDTIYILNTVQNYSLSLYKKVSGVQQLVLSSIKNKDGQTTFTLDHCKHLLSNIVLPPSDNNQYVLRYSSTSANMTDLKVYRKSYSATYHNFRYAEGNRISKIGYFKERNVLKTILDTPAGAATAEKLYTFDYSDQAEANTSSGRVRTTYQADHEMKPFNVIYNEVLVTNSGVGKQYANYGFQDRSIWPKNIRTDVRESKMFDLSNQLISHNTHTYTYDAPKMFILTNEVTSKNYEGSDFIASNSVQVFDEGHRQMLYITAEDNLGKTIKSEFTYQPINNAIVNTQVNKYVNGNHKEHVVNTYGPKGDLIKSEFKTPEMSSYEQTGILNPWYQNGLLRGYTQLDGTQVTLIYGYNNTQLVAKMINVDALIYYNNSSYLNLRSNISSQSNQSSFTYSEQNLKNTLNSLRGKFPDAMVTTYTYLPMIGISSITDENAKTTTYEYDAFNRLKSIKDHSGNILNEYQYNFTN